MRYVIILGSYDCNGLFSVANFALLATPGVPAFVQLRLLSVITKSFSCFRRFH